VSELRDELDEVRSGLVLIMLMIIMMIMTMDIIIIFSVKSILFLVVITVIITTTLLVCVRHVEERMGELSQMVGLFTGKLLDQQSQVRGMTYQC
jgi:uncharacterized membrane protein